MIGVSVKIEKPTKGTRRSAGRRLKSGGIRTQGKGRFRQRVRGGQFAASVGGILGSELAIGMAYGLASEIKRRVAIKGKPVDSTRSRYSAQRQKRVYREDGSVKNVLKPVFISPAYPNANDPMHTTPDGVKIFQSSFHFHASQGAFKPNRFNISGGMWSGLSVVPRARSSRRQRADIEFRGRSEGQRVNWGSDRQLFDRTKSGTEARQAKADAKAAAKGKKSRKVRKLAAVKPKGLKIDNSKKAATIARSMDIHLLRITNEERNSLNIAIQTLLAGGIVRMSGGEMEFQKLPRGGNPRIVSQLLRATEAVVASTRRVR